jgi:hypothetical protein
MTFKSSINEATSQITISDGVNSLVLQTADGVAATGAIKFASTLLDVPALPEFLAFTPFKIRFLADGGAQLVKEGRGAVSFNKDNYEDLISSISTTINQCTDKLRIRGGARPGLPSAGAGEPIS